ncbi:MAG TPA: polysaccharide deacetylase family protein [Acholeplasmataceae bacterium]|nr:polysaccharide deacetylase family protein [Acholeplasmataceae bacterium]
MIYVVYGLIIFICLFIIIHLIAFIIFKRNFVPILMYHRVTDDVKPKELRYIEHKGSTLDLDSMKVKVDVFNKQMEYLKKKGYKTKHLSKEIINKEKKTVYLTFDDGYSDNYEFAYPILKQYNFQAVFFLTAGIIDKNEFMPIDENDKRKENRLLTWDEAKEMVNGGMQLGAHTLNHIWLTNDDVNIEEEIVGSKRLIEERLNIFVNTFAYPAGMYNEKAVEIVRNNFECAVITSRGSDFPNNNKDPYLLERETISSSDSMFMFKLKLFGIHRFLRKLKWLNKLRGVIKWLLRR